METDPQVLLVLIAVRLLGGRSLPKNAGVFRGLKVAVAKAVEQGLITADTAEVAGISQSGRARTKLLNVWTLTPQGEAYLQQGASAEVLAAAAGRQKSALLEQLQADREALKCEVLAHIDRVFAPLERKIQGAARPPAPVLHAAVLQRPAEGPSP